MKSTGKSAKAVAPVQRASGGKTPQLVAGNKNVIEAAEKKKGGRAKKKEGGKVVGLMTGGSVRPRLDRPGRRQGGAVGANTSPLSTAHNTTSAPKQAD
jgi:hypothetical protein